MADYVVKRGDTLWKIASANKSKISGSTINKKIDTLVEVNNIKNKNLIYVGQKINFSSSSSSSGSSTPPSTKPVISGFGLKSDDTSGRSMIVNWSWSKSGTKGYTCRWLQYLNNKWVGDDTDIPHSEDRYCQSTFNADAAATQVSFQVRPYKKKDGDKITYFSDSEGNWSDKQTYNFSDNPPQVPPTPKVELDTANDRKLKISIDPIDAKTLDAQYVNFDIYKNYTTKVTTIQKVTINTAVNRVSTEWVGEYGNDYRVRAQSVSEKGKTSGWSEFVDVGTKPCAPASIKQPYRNKRPDGTILACLEWSAVSNATHYIIEYTTLRENFETGVKDWDEVQTDGPRTSVELTGIAIGSDYFFRVKAVNNNGTSEPTDIVSLAVGEPPAAPTTWSTANSAFAGETMELNWSHNSRDGSSQTSANLRLKINDGDWINEAVPNETTANSGETVEETNWTDDVYGTVGTFVSYKGQMYFKMDTDNVNFKNAKIQWQVRTAGVTSDFSDTDWSVDRTIYIYEKPALALSVTKDVSGTIPFENVEIPPETEGDEPIVIRKALTTFPFYIRGRVELDSYTVQKPIGYHLQILANDYYETTDGAGRTKVINAGDAVYSKYFDTDATLIVEMSAENIDLEPLISYTVRCDVDMSTGLSVSNEDEFNVYWSDEAYVIDAIVNVNEESYTATIVPMCIDAEGNYVDNLTLSVYRREYDGNFTKIATNVPNNGTAVTDPHPALDHARYRLVAKDTNTGAMSFYDLPGQKIGCTSVIVQWDEEWTSYDVNGAVSVDTPMWSGSMLILPYNVKITDSRTREVSRVVYAGREYPVAYHGTAISEESSWSMVIPKTDTDTIFALRRLSLWAGSVYIREPSGMGFWATVVPSFNIDYDAVTIPVTLDVIRVEGGV